MNRQQFSEYINNPGATNAQSLKMLEDLVKRYPYCQTSQILFAFNLFKEENLQFPLQLKKAAAYAGDRRKLKDLLDFGKTKAIIEKPEKIKETDISATEMLQSIKTEEYLENSGAISPEELAALPDLNSQPGVLQNDSPGIEFSIFPDVPGSNGRMTPEELLEIVKKRLTEIKAGKERVVTPPKTSSLLPPESVHDKNSLIEKFIREEPKISKPKANFFNPSESSHRSNFDEEEIVSETLAQLYAKQGNIPKAIHIYEKLSLLNQEKSRYFAAQIDKIKQSS